MSEHDKGGREWRLFVADMIKFCEQVLAYTRGLGQAEFLDDHKTYDAVLRNLELLGEAAIHVPQRVREARPDVPWRAIVGMRNRLIHGYLGIDDDLVWCGVVWCAVRDDTPVLVTALRHLLEDEPNERRS